jgi:ABC-type lipoprotein release transport system permease subunit
VPYKKNSLKMLILKTAIKNIIGAGARTWLNVSVLSFTFVLMVAFNGVIDGWVIKSKTDTVKWDAAKGQIWQQHYDPLDVFSLQDAHAPVPDVFKSYISNQSLTPVLVVQAAIYPQGHFRNVLLRGIDPHQQAVALPTEILKPQEGELPVLIGKRMANAAKLQQGDHVMLRWRDKAGAFDARDVLIAGIFDSSLPNIDSEQMWLNINDLYQLTGMTDEATYFIAANTSSTLPPVPEGWTMKTQADLLRDIDEMIKADRVESIIIFVILLAISLLAVFDTQVLSIFRRQREIGTYVAMGMTPKTVTHLFTLEGTGYSILALMVSLVWGTPLLYWFSKVGWPMGGAAYGDKLIGMDTALLPVFTLTAVLTVATVIIVMSAVISYLPARRIARQNTVMALKGKLN